MKGVVVIGTDTDAGKTSFCALLLSRLPDQFEYWKPVETGRSDSALIQRLTRATVHPPLAQFQRAVAPALAAHSEGRTVPTADEIAAAIPPCSPGKRLLIETFGSPFSPLSDHELQLALITRLASPTVLICSSAVGAIGRTLQCCTALQSHNALPAAIVLLGPDDPYAAEQIRLHGPVQHVYGLRLPGRYTSDAIARSSQDAPVLDQIISCVANHGL